VKNQFARGVTTVTQEVVAQVAQISSASIKGVLSIVTSINTLISNASTMTTTAYGFAVKAASAFVRWLLCYCRVEL
jgi:hypothetical protein